MANFISVFTDYVENQSGMSTYINDTQQNEPPYIILFENRQDDSLDNWEIHTVYIEVVTLKGESGYESAVTLFKTLTKLNGCDITDGTDTINIINDLSPTPMNSFVGDDGRMHYVKSFEFKCRYQTI